MAWVLRFIAESVCIFFCVSKCICVQKLNNAKTDGISRPSCHAGKKPRAILRAPFGRRLLYALRLCHAFSASRFLSGADFAVALI